jgi:hypothetical protein
VASYRGLIPATGSGWVRLQGVFLVVEFTMPVLILILALYYRRTAETG